MYFQISEQINTLHSHLKMRPTQTRLKFFTCQRVEEMLKWLYPEAMVLPFGSGATGLGLVDGSDLDMNLAINEEQVCQEICYLIYLLYIF